MLSSDVFNTYAPQKQAEIITRLMSLFKSNERGHGAGEVKGAKFNEDKNKWLPGNIRLEKKMATEAEWRAHLAGERFLGLGPLLDDSTVWYGTLDIDKLKDTVNYDFDYFEEMGKITRSGFPLVVFRTKSGGLRPTLFFSEPIDAELVIRRMMQIAAQLGYVPCEIFPKQAKLDLANGDYSSWIFMPFGPQADIFPEQCCMNESGNAMELGDAVNYAMQKRINKEQFLNFYIEEKTARANGKANGKTHQNGAWSEDETYELTLRTTFWDGPPCLWHLAHQKCTKDQHYFLLNCASFFRRKYPDNWDTPLKWTNFNVLVPRGDPEKLVDMIKDLRKKEQVGKEYEYTCKTEPICSHCFSQACQKQPFGVGQGKGNFNHFELGLTIINRIPRMFIANVGEERMVLDSHAFLTQAKYKEICLDHGIAFPSNMTRNDWDAVVRKNIEEATIVDPSELLKTNADELWALGKYLDGRIKLGVRTRGEEYFKGRWGDDVRIKLDEEKIYFKWDRLKFYCDRVLQWNERKINDMKLFIDNKAEFHDRLKLRDWFRSSWSMRFNQFDPGVVDLWLHPDAQAEENEDEQLDSAPTKPTDSI